MSRRKMSTTKTAMLQLAARGAQDDHLTSAENTIFKYGIKKHTPFTTVTVPLEFNESGFFGKTVTVNITPDGDMLRSLLLYVRLPALLPPSGSSYIGWANAVGHALIDSVELMIGGRTVEKQSGLFMDVCLPFSVDPGKAEIVNKMIGRYDTARVLPRNATAPTDIYVPLQFWFTKRLASALPLCLLFRHEVKLRFKIRSFRDVVTHDGNVTPQEVPVLDAKVLADYVILDEGARADLMSKQCHEIVFEQWQSIIDTSIAPGKRTVRIDLPFSNCVKDIVWVLAETASVENNDYFFFGRRDPMFQDGEFFSTASLHLDGNVRFLKLPESYYRMVTTAQHHRSGEAKNVYTISFAEAADAFHPTGSANLSRFDSTSLYLEMVPGLPVECMVFLLARGYNVLRIKDGMASVEFAT
jgi:major capsid protein